ncbi:MAG: Fic family protein [Thermodesulfobacteriota bacterium]|nr:Fic family protein [Thermodesulfobacteriota bacterium]
MDVASIEPLFPHDKPVLQELALRVATESAALAKCLHPKSLAGIVELLRIINSYYSNLIEGNSTHPSDVERATREEYAADAAERDLQLESLAHISCQRQIEARLEAEPGINPSSEDFIRWMHRMFYEQLPDTFKYVQHSETEERLYVEGGRLRHRGVKVGVHHAPPEHLISALLGRFSQTYQNRVHGSNKIIAVAAAHHRLTWIHPFLDGNGRVARLYADACFQALPLPGYGLWNVSRGLARDREAYMKMLAQADRRRQSDYDGRGALSEQCLVDFCEYFLDVCIDQIGYMANLLDLDNLLDRIEGYVKMRNAKLISSPLPVKYPSLKLEAAKMLQQVLLRGEMSRGDVAAASGLSRAGRTILNQLVDEGILKSDMPKGSVRLAFPIHMASHLFRGLYPDRIG